MVSIYLSFNPQHALSSCFHVYLWWCHLCAWGLHSLCFICLGWDLATPSLSKRPHTQAPHVHALLDLLSHRWLTSSASFLSYGTTSSHLWVAGLLLLVFLLVSTPQPFISAAVLLFTTFTFTFYNFYINFSQTSGMHCVLSELWSYL